MDNKSTGIVRRVDELGRIVVPKEIRRTLCIAEGAPLEIFVEGDQIVLRKYKDACTFCGATQNTIEFRDVLVCHVCIAALNKELR